MAPRFSDVSEATRKAMRANKAKDTTPELKVRRLLRELGFRYRLHRRDLPGRPDIAFIARRKAIFVHGCFWHQHPEPQCQIARMPKSRLDFWRPKLEGNRRRDEAATKALENQGWRVLTLWECGLKDMEGTRGVLLSFLRDDGDAGD